MTQPTRILVILLVLSGWLAPTVWPALAAEPGPGQGGSQVIHLTAPGGDPANALAFSSDGRLLAVGSRLGIHLYDAQSLTEIRFIQTTAWVRSLAFSPDGRWLASGAYEPSVRLWSVADGTQYRELTGHTGWVHSVVFAPNGETLASASDDNTVRLWRMSDGTPLTILTTGVVGVRAVVFSPDGALLATGGYDDVVRLWRPADGTLLHELMGHTGWVRCLAFAPDGRTLASGGFDTTTRLWRVADGTLLHTLNGHTATVMSVAFSPDGATLATGSTDTTVRLWGVAEGTAQASLKGHTDFVFAVAFAPDGRTLASAGTDSTVQLWPLGSGLLPPATAEQSEPPAASGAPNCGQCHHPHGSTLSPNSLQPARVVEVSCVTCHTDGPLVRSWDPTFPRSPGPTTVTSSPPVASDQIGLPHATRDLRVEIATPGNGENIYSGGEIMAFVPLAGRVALAAGQPSDVLVSLEIWSGAVRLGGWTTRPRPDGTFSFALGVNAGQSALTQPIDNRDCQSCHDPNNELFSVGDYRSIVLPAGEVHLLVTARSPAGAQASDDRWVMVDPSGRASVSVHTVLEGAAGQTLAGLPVQSVTRLYEWRGRTFASTTGANGSTDFQVEALSAAPTRYTFQIKPTVVNGRLYESVSPVAVVLPPGAITAPSITLTVRARGGQIAGQLANAQPAVTMHAIHWPEGTRYDAQASASGSFAFQNLPIGRYLVLADEQALASHGLTSTGETLDLAQSPDADVIIRTRPLVGSTLQGTVSDDQGRPVPFGWVNLGQDGQPTPLYADSGTWNLADVTPEARTVVASAPGFYSQAFALPSQTGPASPILFRLTPLPALRRLAWGPGMISLPSETQARVAGQQIDLTNGWLWGTGSTSQTWVIHTAGVTITLNSGRFALFNLPRQGAWFYLLEGNAKAQPAEAPGPACDLTGPSMLALAEPGELKAMPLDEVVMRAMPPGLLTPGQAIWEPTMAARVRDGLALLGIQTAQVLTLATYLAAILALFVVPLAILSWWARRRQQSAEMRK